jgi:hypothetical protein
MFFNVCNFQVEPHYGTEYQVEKIPKDVLSDWRSSSTDSQLRLPDANELIDKNQTSRFTLFYPVSKGTIVHRNFAMKCETNIAKQVHNSNFLENA